MQEVDFDAPEALLAIEYTGDASTIGIIWLTRGPNCTEELQPFIVQLWFD